MLLVARRRADFEELKAELNPPVTPALEATLMMTPLLCFHIELRTGKVTVIGPRTLTVSIATIRKVSCIQKAEDDSPQHY